MRTATAAAFAATLAAVTIGILTPGVRDRIPPTLDDFCNSAPVPFGELVVNVDVTENDAPPEPGSSSVFYSLDGQASWSEVQLAEAPGHEGGTWGASFPIQDGDVSYYFVVRDDSAASMSSPWNSGDAFPPPPNLMVDTGMESAGDVVDPLNESLDLDGFQVGYSDSFLYATLSNVTGEWPTAHTVLGPWFLYSLVLDNPDAGPDSTAFALVYANVPLVGQSGLYVVDARDSSYARIGDIDHSISEGDMHMRCRLQDLYAHPYFGAENPSGCYVLGAGTAVAWLADLGEAADATYAHAYYHRTDTAVTGQNQSPVLSAPGHSLTDEQGTNGAVVRLSVTYSDPDGHLPTVHTAVVDGDPYEMSSGPEHDYDSGVEFSVEIDLTLEDHIYYFSFSDGAANVETPPDTIPLGSGTPESHGTTGVVFTSIWPRPATSTANIAFDLPEHLRGRLDIFDVGGRHVRLLWSGTGGRTSCEWDGLNDSGEPVPGGVYFLRLSSSLGSATDKLVLLK